MEIKEIDYVLVYEYFHKIKINENCHKIQPSFSFWRIRTGLMKNSARIALSIAIAIDNRLEAHLAPKRDRLEAGRARPPESANWRTEGDIPSEL